MRTEIATLGEFGLIKHLTEGIKLENESSKYGVGDDAAVLSYPADKQVLVTYRPLDGRCTFRPNLHAVKAFGIQICCG